MSPYCPGNLASISFAVLASCSACVPVEDLDVVDDRALSAQHESLSAADKLLIFGAKQPVTLSRSTPVHAFTFELSDRASIALSTQSDGSAQEVDTVIALHRARNHGWGPVIARSDDDGNSRFSRIARELPKGRYRLQVKGFKRSTAGVFALSATCQGEGCPAEPTRCLFGNDVSELGSRNDVVVSRREPVTAADQLLDDVQSAQLLNAVQIAAPEVRDVAQALSSVDRGSVERLWLWDPMGSRQFTAYQYTLNGSVYGAVFTQGTVAFVARIEAGKLSECSVRPERCLFGGTYHELRESSAFTLASASVITPSNAATLSALQQTQLLAAVQVAYEEASDLDSALSSVDQSEINLLVVRELEGGRSFTAYEYGAGDNSYGAVFESESATMATQIQDGDLYACRVFAP